MRVADIKSWERTHPWDDPVQVQQDMFLEMMILEITKHRTQGVL